MKKISLAIILSINLLANGYEANFIKELHLDKIPKEIQTIINSDEKYQLAIKQLTKEEFMAKKEIIMGDPHHPETQTKKSVTVPNFNEAYINLKSSYTQTQNPLSAYVIVNLIKTSYTIKNKMDDFARYSKINYENGLCSGYIDYGDSLSFGYSQKADKQKAIKVYKEGLEKCKTGWYASILSSKIQRMGQDD